MVDGRVYGYAMNTTLTNGAAPQDITNNWIFDAFSDVPIMFSCLGKEIYGKTWLKSI